MQELIDATEQISAGEEDVTSACAGENITYLKQRYERVKVHVAKYDQSVQDVIAEQEKVIKLQEEIISTGSFLGGLLTVSERTCIRNEVDNAKQIFNLHIRDNNYSNDLHHVFDPFLFQRLVVDIKAKCPTITNILEQLVLSPNVSRNVIRTENLKMKAAIHLLASLLDIRDQHAKNDIPLLFGLLCICYGAGPSVIRILQRLGLTESFPTL